MIIYADILFLINAAINYVLLLCVCAILKLPFKRFRLLLSSLFAGAYALSILISLPSAVNLLLKIASCFLITWIAFGFVGLRLFLSRAFLYLLFNVFLSGIVLLLGEWNEAAFYTDFCVNYINISPLELLISMLICYALTRLLYRLLKRKHTGSVFKVDVIIENRKYRFFAFADSGNHLSEPFSGAPVCIIKTGIINHFESLAHQRMIPFASLGGEGLLFAVPCTMNIHIGNTVKTVTQVYIGESDAGLKHSPYDMILNQKVLEEDQHENETLFT